MRYNLLTPDGEEVGYITDDPGFRWELAEHFPHRRNVLRFIEASTDYEMVVTGGAEPATNALTPPEEKVPANDRFRLTRLASELPKQVPIQVEEADDTKKTHIAESLVHAVSKERVYVDDPSEVPEGVEPQEGDQGGLYYETEQIDGEGGGGGDEPTFGGMSTTEWMQTFDPSAAESQTPLADVEGETGQNAGAMSIYTMPDGSEAYVTEYGDDGADPESRDRAMAGYAMAEMIGASVPAHKMGKDGEWVAVRGVNGEEAWRAPDEWAEKADPEEYINEAAAQLLIGNKDAHGGNVMVDEDGGMHFIDTDASGYNMMDEEYEGGHAGHEAAISKLAMTYGDIFGHDDADDVQNRIYAKAEQLARIVQEDDEFEQALDASSDINDEFAENIRANIEGFASRSNDDS